jgi:hypothetical protein
MRPKVQDGRPLHSGVVKAADQEREVHRGLDRPGETLLTPAQKTEALERGEWPADPEPAPGYESHTITVKSDQELAEEKRRRATDARSAPAAKTDVAGAIRAEAAAVSREVIAHGRQRVAEGIRTMESGTPAEKARVPGDIAMAMAIANTAKKVLGG